MKEQLQNSLFGYSKQSVHRYLSEMNEDFSNRLLAKEKEGRDAARALQTELERLRKENEQLRAERREVAGALIGAEAFAADLRKQAEEKDRIQRAKNEDIRRADRQRLQELAGHIDKLRDTIRSTLSSMEADMEQYALLSKAIHAEYAKSSPTEEQGAEPQNESAEQDSEPACE